MATVPTSLAVHVVDVIGVRRLIAPRNVEMGSHMVLTAVNYVDVLI
jgi:hypothetical protein